MAPALQIHPSPLLLPTPSPLDRPMVIQAPLSALSLSALSLSALSLSALSHSALSHSALSHPPRHSTLATTQYRIAVHFPPSILQQASRNRRTLLGSRVPRAHHPRRLPPRSHRSPLYARAAAAAASPRAEGAGAVTVANGVNSAEERKGDEGSRTNEGPDSYGALRVVSDLERETMDLLEWPILCRQVARFADTVMGYRVAEEGRIAVGRTWEESQQLLQQTGAALLLPRRLDFNGAVDVGGILARLDRAAAAALAAAGAGDAAATGIDGDAGGAADYSSGSDTDTDTSGTNDSVTNVTNVTSVTTAAPSPVMTITPSELLAVASLLQSGVELGASLGLHPDPASGTLLPSHPLQDSTHSSNTSDSSDSNDSSSSSSIIGIGCNKTFDSISASPLAPLTAILSSAPICPSLLLRITTAINPQLKSLADSASAELAAIRTARRDNRRQLDESLRKAARRVVAGGGMDEAQVSRRRGRGCVAVRAGKKSGLLPGGVTLDVSNTGATLFVEPKEVIELNNKEAELSGEEAEEERRVLWELAELVADCAPLIRDLTDRIVVLDLACARARHALWMDASSPLLLPPAHPHSHNKTTISGVNSLEKGTTSEGTTSRGTSTAAEHAIDPTYRVEIRGMQHPVLLELYLDAVTVAKGGSAGATAATAAPTAAPTAAAATPSPPVPIDLLVPAGTSVVIISGPNAGGKTAALKTLGIAALMAKAGLYLPHKREGGDGRGEVGGGEDGENGESGEARGEAEGGEGEEVRGVRVTAEESVESGGVGTGRGYVAVLPWFDAVVADIGDEQSLEQNLSTFSGHLRRISRILLSSSSSSASASAASSSPPSSSTSLSSAPAASSSSASSSPSPSSSSTPSNSSLLVLLDEVGSGTDPSEGAALATAVLRHLAQSHGLTVATTHYADLKKLKSSDPRFENASVAFDRSTLRPSFNILWGRPGTSHALSLAASRGLPPSLVARASRLAQEASREEREEAGERKVEGESSGGGEGRKGEGDTDGEEVEKFAGPGGGSRVGDEAGMVASLRQQWQRNVQDAQEAALMRQDAERLLTDLRSHHTSRQGQPLALREVQWKRRYQRDVQEGVLSAREAISQAVAVFELAALAAVPGREATDQACADVAAVAGRSELFSNPDSAGGLGAAPGGSAGGSADAGASDWVPTLGEAVYVRRFGSSMRGTVVAVSSGSGEGSAEGAGSATAGRSVTVQLGNLRLQVQRGDLLPAAGSDGEGDGRANGQAGGRGGEAAGGGSSRGSLFGGRWDQEDSTDNNTYNSSSGSSKRGSRFPSSSSSSSSPLPAVREAAVQTARNTVDVRGRSVQDALAEVDLAVQSSPPGAVLFIVHGLGTGVVRAAVLKYLSGSSLVSRHEAESKLNIGCTIAYIG